VAASLQIVVPFRVTLARHLEARFGVGGALNEFIVGTVPVVERRLIIIISVLAGVVSRAAAPVAFSAMMRAKVPLGGIGTAAGGTGARGDDVAADAERDEHCGNESVRRK